MGSLGGFAHGGLLLHGDGRVGGTFVLDSAGRDEDGFGRGLFGGAFGALGEDVAFVDPDLDADAAKGGVASAMP